MGDAVYEQLVREMLVLKNGTMPADKLHRSAVKWVCAATQAKMADILIDSFDETELAIYKRGRNANSIKAPKNSSPSDYRKATGLEALFGYLYLEKKMDRINELFAVISQNMELLNSEVEKNDKDAKDSKNEKMV